MAYTLIDCGGAGDNYASGGLTYDYNYGAADVSGVVNPVNPEFYRTVRYTDFTYMIPGFVPNQPVRVRLHFASGYPPDAGNQRLGDYYVNGQLYLDNFSIIDQAGAPYKAIVREADFTTDAQGRIIIQVVSVAGGAHISAIEIIPPVPPAITTTNLPNATPNVFYDEEIAISGGTAPYTVAAIGGEIPEGVALAGKRFQGNPTGRFGTFPVELRVTDATGLSSTKIVYILVKPPAPVIVTQTPLRWAQTGKSYSVQLEKRGGTGFGAWSAQAGNLPGGALAANGLITIPIVGANNYSFIARFTDVDGDIAEAALTIPVSPFAAFDFCYRYPLSVRTIERERVFEPIQGTEEVIEDAQPKREFTMQVMFAGRANHARLAAFLLENRRRKPFLFFDEYAQSWITVKRVSEFSESQMFYYGNFEIVLREV